MVQNPAKTCIPMERCDHAPYEEAPAEYLTYCFTFHATSLAWPTRACIGTRWIADWSAVDPMEYLTPFIEVIRSPEISGPITGAALTAVSRFLDAYIIGEQHMLPLSC